MTLYDQQAMTGRLRRLRGILTLFVLLGCLSACSGGSSNAARDSSTNISTENLLKPVSFNNDILELQNHIVSYSKKANRVSIINLRSMLEIISWEVEPHDFALTLPDLESVALVSDQHVKILTEKSSRIFPLSGSMQYVSAALNHPTISFSQADGRGFEVIRFIGNSQWQHDSFLVPWSKDASLSEQAKEDLSLITQLNSAGTLLAAVSPGLGRYAIYEANSDSGPIEDTRDSCGGFDADGTIGNSFSSIAWDESQHQFYLGDNGGNIVALSPNDCRNMAELPQLKLTSRHVIVDIALLESGLISVLQGGGDEMETLVTLLSFDGSEFRQEFEYETPACKIPVSSMSLSQGQLVLLCSEAVNSTSAGSSGVYRDPFKYLVVNVETKKVINEVIIDGENSASVAIDPSTSTLYRVLEGAFGVIEATHLLDGEKVTYNNLYIQQILNE